MTIQKCEAKKAITIESAPNGGFAVYEDRAEFNHRSYLIGAYSSLDDLAAALRPLLYQGNTPPNPIKQKGASQ